MLDETASMIQYRGDGGESVFPIPFPFQEAAHIHAHVSEGMTMRSLAPGVDFTIAAGELVLLGEKLPAGQLLTIRRLLPLTQEILFHNQGPNSPQAIEEAVDKLTMISQQLQAAVEVCVQAPDAETAAELAGSAAANAARVAAVEQSLSAKADRNHSHAQSEIPGLAAALAAKADAAATMQALAGKASLAQLSAKADSTALANKADKSELSAKADASQLALKADAVHSHSVSVDSVDGLGAALAAKLDADDPRLDLIGSGGGGTADHAQLENRDAADQHPQSAVTNLTDDLSAIRADLAARGAADDELFDHIETLAARTDELSAADGALGGRLGAVETGIAALGGDLAGIGETIEANSAELAALGGRVASAETNAAGVRSALAEMQTEVGEMKTDVTETRTEMTGVRTEVSEMKTEVGEMKTDVTDVQTEVSEAESSLAAVATVLERVTARLAALEENSGGGGETPGQSAGGGFVGDIRLVPFRPGELPFGWYFCDGGALLFSSAAGQVLAAMPAQYKRDWGIEVVDGSVTLPNLFDRETGAGLFLRGADGLDRLPGSAQSDAIRNISGSFSSSNNTGVVIVTPASGLPSTLTGAFTTQTAPAPKQFCHELLNVGPNRVGDLLFDASRVVPVAEENRPVNIGMTPAIYLGA